jgi:hypothetical protein
MRLGACSQQCVISELEIAVEQLSVAHADLEAISALLAGESLGRQRLLQAQTEAVGGLWGGFAHESAARGTAAAADAQGTVFHSVYFAEAHPSSATIAHYFLFLYIWIFQIYC